MMPRTQVVREGGGSEMSRYPLFDRGKVVLGPLAERGHDLTIDGVWPLEPPKEPYSHPEFPELIRQICEARAGCARFGTGATCLSAIRSSQPRWARERDRQVILMMGAHPIKLGLSRFVIDLMDRGILTHVATNGAGIIHDFELASFGGTSENVAKWIRQGRFGMWEETSRLNEIIREAADAGEGMGEAVGRVLCEGSAPHSDVSICAAGWRNGIPVTSHVLLGGDILHGMLNASGTAFGAVSDTDFLIFAQSVSQLSGGVLLNVGTAVTGPEVFLKALSMARNVAHQRGESVSDFTTAVFDLAELPENFRDGPPGKDHPQYYYRPWKTLLCRTVAESGKSFYFQGDQRETIPTLWHYLIHH